MLKLGDPFVFGVLVPALALLLLALLPYALPQAQPGELGRWLPRGNRSAQAITAGLALLILILTLMGAIRK